MLVPRTARIPTGSRQPFTGGWVSTDRVCNNNTRSRESKLRRILEDPYAVLDNLVEQHDVRGVWDPSHRHFVLRNGNHRLRVAYKLGRPYFFIHTILTAGDMDWKELILNNPTKLATLGLIVGSSA